LTSFFATQLDYIFFLYGFSFITVAVVCLPLAKRPGMILPCKWLGLFGLVHGFNEWLDMVALVFGDHRTFAFIRFIVMTLSFLFLFEFGRLGIRQLLKRGPGRWIYLPMLVPLVASTFVLPASEANAIARYLFGLTGALGSALGVALYRKKYFPKDPWLLLVVVAMAAYGIAAGFLVSRTSFFPGAVFNAQAISGFLSGTPIQVFRAGFALLISLGVWQHYLGLSIRAVQGKRKKDPIITWLGQSLLVILALGWIGTEAGRDYGKKLDESAMLARHESAQEIARHSIQLMERTAQTVSQSGDLIEVILNPSPANSVRANQVLDRFSSFIPGAIVYVLDRGGKVIASSNRNTPISFVGEQFGMRPYFREAMAGKTGHYWSIGLKTGQMSYYIGVPVFDSAGKIHGVLAYRAAIADFSVFRLINNPAWVTDQHGLVILANDPALLYRTMDRLTPELLNTLKDQYQNLQIKPQPVFQQTPKNGELLHWNGQEYRFWSHDGSVADWKFIFLSPSQSYTPFRFAGIIITVLVTLLATGFFMARQQENDNQDNLIESEARYRQLFEENSAVMLIIEPDTGLIQDANRVAGQFYRVSLEELRSRSIFDLTALERENVLSWFKKIEMAGRDQSEFRHRLSSQEVRDVEIYSMWLSQRGRNVVFAIVFDISERKRIEAERIQFQAQLFHSEKLASIGTLAAGVGHEINNPLTIIRGLVEVLKSRLEGKGTSDEIGKLLNKQELAVERIARIVSGLRTFARSDTSHFEQVNLHVIIGETLALIEQIYKKAGIEVVLKLNSVKPYFQGNHGKLQQVIMNLISNAKDALDGKEGRRMIELISSDSDDSIFFEIRDNGAGIPADKLGKVFDPFFTTKPPGQGTGLGLPICRSIVESFGGKIIVESAQGVGTSFIIELPRQKRLPQNTGAAVQEQMVVWKGRVIVVDDESDIREIFREYLAILGFQVVEACNGADAATLMAESVFDFAIIDIHMPGMSGDILIEKVRQFPTCNETKLIATSAGIVTQFSGEQRETLRRSIHGYLQKPFDRDTLNKLLKSVTKGL